MPQEIGGVQPHCAYLDVDRRELSREMLTELGISNTTNNDPIVRSRQIDILFSSHDFLLFRQREARHIGSYELARSAILAIDWCMN